MVSKFLNYERNPPSDPDFYNHPITALGWQTSRWFQVCSEVVGGYLKNVHGKDPVRINAVYLGNPNSDPWSTANNSSTVLSYFGPSGLGYIPATPQELGGFSGGTGSDVINAINSGSFMLQHRDHGGYSGWGEPSFSSSSINSLTNIDNKLPYIFSINCQTGAFHRSSECFTEKFHRHTYNGQNSGALGVIAATEVSYSFVNDTYMWGVMDNLFPDFMPDENTTFPVNFVMPAFGNVAGKHFLHGSSWPYNTNNKLITYRLFHHHGDAFLTLYTEVPQNLNVDHEDVLLAGATSFTVDVNDGAFIALTVDGEIIGTALSNGSPTSINIPVQEPENEMIVTIPRPSGGYTPSFVHVDGSIPDNWSDTATENEWCTGSGTREEPYIIENCTIDASSSPIESGIFINNSKNVYFIIRNCSLSNAGSDNQDGGIKLENTNNGTIYNNTCCYPSCVFYPCCNITSNIRPTDSMMYHNLFLLKNFWEILISWKIY